MELQNEISKLPKLKIPSLFGDEPPRSQIINLKKKKSNNFRYTTESVIEENIKLDESIFNENNENSSLKETSENWIG